MSGAIQIIPNGIGVNVYGLKIGQAELYKYFLECEKEGKQIDMWRVAEIYYTYVATREATRYHNGKIWIPCTISEYLQWLKETYPNYTFYSPKNWLKMNLGAFVMRGLLHVIPKFRPEDQE